MKEAQWTSILYTVLSHSLIKLLQIAAHGLENTEKIPNIYIYIYFMIVIVVCGIIYYISLKYAVY